MSTPASTRTEEYRAPDAAVRDEQHISEAELLAFAGPEGEYYLRQWRGLQEGRGPWTRLHVPAFLFGLLWCFYRRMYLLGLVGSFVQGLAVEALMVAAAVLVGDAVQGSIALSAAVVLTAWVIPQVVFAKLASWFYW